MMKKEFEWIEREPSIKVVCRKSSRKSLFHRMRDALEESAPPLSVEEIKDQVAPDQMFSAALACLIFGLARNQREEPRE